MLIIILIRIMFKFKIRIPSVVSGAGPTLHSEHIGLGYELRSEYDC